MSIVLVMLLILSALGVISAKKPVYSGISFLACLLLLSAIYVSLSAEFIAIMQVLIYAGAILVIFMFVMILFQDAHQQIEKSSPKASWFLTRFASVVFVGAVLLLVKQWWEMPIKRELPHKLFDSMQALGETLYVDFFFPFEAVVLLFLTALVGSVYIARRGISK